MSEREDLIAEAQDLGLKFKGNISTVKLAALVANADGAPPPVEETPPPSPLAKKAEPDEEETSQTSKPVNKVVSQRAHIAQRRKEAMTTHVVTITNKDNRENDVMTTVYLGFENQYFGLAKNVPLDIPVELEQALIDIAEKTTMTLPKDEIIDGKRTGNKVATTVKKFAISYAKNR
mgnify:CR=1 FL=1